jgi:flotillin
MEGLSLTPFFGIIVVIAAFFLIMFFTYKALYKKAPADAALVISGGKSKSVVFGGKIVNPLTKATQLVSLNTMQLLVQRAGPDALITKDSLRVDIEAQFYVKIEPNEQDVLSAVASLGDKTLHPENVKALLEGKLVGILRSVAATMELQELHEKRQDFSDQVRESCKDDLEQNGFQLESVAVTNLDQTPLDQLDSNNRFDVVAIQTINQEVQERQTRTERIKHENRVKQEEDKLRADLAIKQQEEATQTESLEVEKRLAFAQEIQRKEVATNKAEQDRAVKEAELQQQQALEEARIRQEEVVQSSQIQQKQRIETARIEQERQVQEAEIEQKRALETARVSQEQEVQTVEIERDQAIEQARIEQERTVEEARVRQQQAIEEANVRRRIVLVERNREEKETQAASEIQIAMKEKELEIASTDRLAATAERTKSEAQVLTVEAIEEAERNSRIALIRAEQEADEERVAKEWLANADAYAVIEAAKAEREAATLRAEAQKILAEAILVEAKAKAEGEEALIEAKNTADQRILNNEALLKLIQSLPEVTGQLMKPAEQIESIRILDLGGNGAGNGAPGGNMGKIFGSILQAGAALPMLKEVLNFGGIDAQDLAKTVSQYVPGLDLTAKTETPESTDQDST